MIAIRFALSFVRETRLLLSCGLLFALSPSLLAEREMAADRPDATESPVTVEPGRVQIESSLSASPANVPTNRSSARA